MHSSKTDGAELSQDTVCVKMQKYLIFVAHFPHQLMQIVCKEALTCFLLIPARGLVQAEASPVGTKTPTQGAACLCHS